MANEPRAVLQLVAMRHPLVLPVPVIARFLRSVTIAIFALLTVHQVVHFVWGGFGSDATLYYRAGAAWVAGGDPWDAFGTFAGNTFHFYAAPTAAIAIAPFTMIPESVFVPLWIALQAASAVFVVRRLHLPFWWVLFPPIITGVLAGNPSLSVLALLVATHPMANALAVMFKAYAGTPLLGERRWRAVMLTIGLGIASVAIAPGLWWTFITDGANRTQRLMAEAEGGFSGFRDPLLFVLGILAIVAIARLDLRRAGWLLPIAVWPASQFHWSTLAMPVMTPVMAIGLAFPVQGLPVVVIALEAIRLTLSNRGRSPRVGRAVNAPRREQTFDQTA